jgi:hypothetical protein
MEVSLVLILLNLSGSLQPVQPPLVLGKFSAMKACEDATKNSELPLFGSNPPGSRVYTGGQFMCVQTK